MYALILLMAILILVNIYLSCCYSLSTTIKDVRANCLCASLLRIWGSSLLRTLHFRHEFFGYIPVHFMNHWSSCSLSFLKWGSSYRLNSEWNQKKLKLLERLNITCQRNVTDVTENYMAFHVFGIWSKIPVSWTYFQAFSVSKHLSRCLKFTANTKLAINLLLI